MASKGTGESAGFSPKTSFQINFLEINPTLTTKTEEWQDCYQHNWWLVTKSLMFVVEDNGTILLWRDPITLNFCQLADKPVQVHREAFGCEAEGEEAELWFVPTKAECSVSCSPGAKLNLDTCISPSQVLITAKIFNYIAQLQTRLNSCTRNRKHVNFGCQE